MDTWNGDADGGDEIVSRRQLFKTVGAGAIGLTLGTQGASAAPAADRHIVGTTRAGERAAKREATSVARVLDFGDIGKAVAGTFPKQARQRLANNPNVRYIEPDATMEALGQTLPWGVDRVDADVASADGNTGDGGDVSIIDTGIDSDHPDLQANLGVGKGYVDTTTGDTEWDDLNGHGTHCAGIAAAVDNSEGVVGVATQATLHAVKALSDDGYGYTSDIAAGIEWTADQGYDVASLSLGGSDASTTMRDAVDYAYSNGVVVVAAAGNDGTSDSVLYPAAYSNAIAVSATDSDDTLASYSSYGPEVELAAPGTYIYSTIPGDYGYKSGTSMACPHVSGAAGILKAQSYTNTEARQRLRDTAEDLGLSSDKQGAGLLDVEAAAKTTSATLAVTTGSASSVTADSVTLNGSLDDLGGASSVDVSFEYRQTGASTWSATSVQTLSTAQTFSASVSGLGEETEYEYRAVAEASDGDTDTGGTVLFTTTDDPAAVSTASPTSVGETVATLNGSLDDLGGAESATVAFEYRQTGASSWSATSGQSLSTTGSFAADVSGLTAGTEYEYRAIAEASDGDVASGSTVTFTTDGDTAVVVSSGDASSITADGATLNGSLDDLGGASSADVYFEYRPSDTSTYSTTNVQTLSAAQTFSASVSGLGEDTQYEYRAVAEASDGDTDAGSQRTFTTANDPPAVTTGSASSVTTDGATLNGSLDDLGGAESGDVAFEWRQTGTSTYNTTAVATRSSTGSFSEAISGLDAATDYEYRARVDAADGDADTGSLVGFSTESGSTGDNAPSVDTYAVSEAGSPNPHADITADWAVSDVDGDLATVSIDVVEASSGTTVDSTQTTVAGGSASGTAEFRIKFAEGASYDVTLTVVDAASNTASATKTLTE